MDEEAPQRRPTSKFVMVLVAKLEPAIVLNAAAHMTAALVSRASPEQRREMAITDYFDADGGAHPVSALSLVVLQAKNGNQLRRAREEARAKALLMVDFLETMTGGLADEQMDRTRAL